MTTLDSLSHWRLERDADGVAWLTFDRAGSAVNAGTYAITANLSLTTGIDNLFDKRLFREGNAQGVTNIAGAGAATYNEPGRTLYTSLTASF